MNIRLSSSSLALVLSAASTKPVFGNDNNANNEITELANRVNSSYEESDQHRRRAKKEQSSSSSLLHSVSDGRVASNKKKKRLDAADLGIFGMIGRGSNRHRRNGDSLLFGTRRFLQNEDEGAGEEEEPTTCLKPDTCEPNLCACVDGGGKGFECAAELNAVCKGEIAKDDGSSFFAIDGCVTSSYVEYYNNFYCPFAKCIVEDGGTLGSCGCAFYAKSYETYKDDERYADDEETLQHFAAHACCQTKDATDEDGLLSCFEEAPTSMPSIAPSAPTTSPTDMPTGSPTVTASPTISPKPTASPTTPSPTKKGEAVVVVDDKNTPPAESPPTPPAPGTSSAQQNNRRWGGSSMSFVVAATTAMVWSLLG